MSTRHLLLAASTIAVSLSIAAPASAFEFLHREPHAKALACYKKIQTPDIYRTVRQTSSCPCCLERNTDKTRRLWVAPQARHG